MEIDKNKLKEMYESTQEDRRRMQEIEDELYKVGYRKPPISGRFQKGQSGNPNGRPPSRKPLAKNLKDALIDSLLKEVQITNQKGKKERKALVELLADKIVQDSIKNDGQSRRMLVQNVDLLNVDLRQVVRNKAFEDFEQATSSIDEQNYRNALFELINQHIENEPDEE